MRITSRIRVAACAAAVAGLLALPGAALAWEAWTYEYNGRGGVFYDPGSESNDVRITRESSTTVKIADRGRRISSHWGWWGSYGCETPDASVGDGTFPARCRHPNGIAWTEPNLRGGDDRLRIGVGLPPVFGRGSGGNDQLDLRDGNGDDHAACGDGIDWALRDPGDLEDGSCESVPLGGAVTSGPAAVSRTAGTLDVFARGGDHDLWQRSWTGSGWTDWARVPGGLVLKGAPAAVATGGGQLDVFVRGGDDQLHRNHFDGANWSGWKPLGGQLGSDPAAVHWGIGRLDVFVRWSDGTLRQKFWDSTFPQGSGWVNLGGGLTSRPAAVSWGGHRLDVFVRGTDNQLYQRTWDGSRWLDWEGRGGGLTSAPAAASRALGSIDVSVRGDDGQLYQLTYEAGRWGDWQGIGGDVAGVDLDPALAASGSGRLDLFTRIGDGSIHQLQLAQ